MTDESFSQIGDALQQQSFLRKVREYLLESEEKRSVLDQEAMMMELDLSFAQQQIASLEGEIQRYHDQVEDFKVSEEERKEVFVQLELEQMLLLDLEALLSGSFRKESARFFTQSALDFATARSWGEMTLLELVANAQGMILECDGDAYAFLHVEKDSYVFHPRILSEGFCKVLKGVSE